MTQPTLFPDTSPASLPDDALRVQLHAAQARADAARLQAGRWMQAWDRAEREADQLARELERRAWPRPEKERYE